MAEERGTFSEESRKAFDKLSGLKDALLSLGHRVMTAGDSRLYDVDLMVIGAVNRALSLNLGFFYLIGSWNLTSAAAVLRMQLDNSMRLWALQLVDDPGALVLSVMGGKPLYKHKDRDGKQLRDGYLLSKLAEDVPWATDVYRETSGFVHLSDKHIFAPFRGRGAGEREWRIEIGPQDTAPESAYREAAAAFRATTELFMWVVEGWIATKEQIAVPSPPEGPGTEVGDGDKEQERQPDR